MRVRRSILDVVDRARAEEFREVPGYVVKRKRKWCLVPLRLLSRDEAFAVFDQLRDRQRVERSAERVRRLRARSERLEGPRAVGAAVVSAVIDYTPGGYLANGIAIDVQRDALAHCPAILESLRDALDDPRWAEILGREEVERMFARAAWAERAPKGGN